MANVNCYGQLVSPRGGIIPLFNTAQTEASEEAVGTDLNYVGSTQAVGTFGTQRPGGFTVAKAGINGENDVTYAFIQSAGKIKMALPMGSGIAGGAQGLPAPLPYPKALAAGDTCVVMLNAVTDRESAVSVACTSGEYHVFSVTPSGSGEQEYVSVLDGQGIGQTLQGRVISHWFATSGNNDAELTSTPMLLDGSGIPIGSVGFTSSGGSVGAVFQPTRTPIALNSRLVFRTDA